MPMPTAKLFSAAEAAGQIGQDKTNIARLAKRVAKQLGQPIGQQIGRVWAFTKADIARMKANAYDGPGSPAFTKGNNLAARRKKKKKKAD